MPKFDRFMIAPEGFSVGLETDKKSWLIPDETFASLSNAYVFRGRVRKRFGSYLMGDQTTGTGTFNSRLAVLLTIPTNGGGNASGTVPGDIVVGRIGQAFTIGTEIFTVYQTGTPAAMLKTGSTVAATYNTTTGAYSFTGATPGTGIYYYPANPVMGFAQYENGPINNQPTYAFDTQFAYLFSGGSWNRSGTAEWHGTNNDFFWTTNYYGTTPNTDYFFVTNFNEIDPMWYFDGTTWTEFSSEAAPVTVFLDNGASAPGAYVRTARIIIPFKNRLLLLNTVERNLSDGPGIYTYHVNRVRFSHLGSPLAPNAWLEGNQDITIGPDTFYGDGASYYDAPTEEEIISAEFIKDRLIVYFERSTWELAFTNNDSDPFRWQKINTELGSEATFSTVPFDKLILTIGNTGIHGCSGANVERIDNKIPQKVFEINDVASSVARIAGIRDFFSEMVYWTFPSDDQSNLSVFPNRILVYNYQNGAWAFNDDSITAWGYFEQQDGATWTSTNWTWASTNNSWGGGQTEAGFRQVIAGNQEGYVFVVDTDTSRNAPALQISNMTWASPTLTLIVINHNLVVGSYVLIENVQGMTGVNGLIMQVQSITGTDILTLSPYQLPPPAPIISISGTYTGGGTLARVSNIEIRSKQWNPYVNEGRNVYIASMDFGVLKTDTGEITVDYFPSASDVSMIQNGTATGAILGTSVLETRPYTLVPLENYQTRLWHPLYFQCEGECIQIVMYYDNLQMVNPEVSLEDFELQGIILKAMAISTRLQ